jgi:hypothetical protein
MAEISSSPEGASRHGPRDPLRPIGDIEVLTHPGTGAQVIRQQYEDGYIYEAMIPRGTDISPRVTHYTVPFFTAKMMRTFSDGEHHFISVWVPHEESKIYDDLFQSAAQQPDFDLQDGPHGEPEILHQDTRLEVARVRYTSGWMYLVKVELGLPWPSFFLIPSLAPTRAAPIVAVEREGTGFISKFWVSDTAPYAPTAA